MAGDVGSSEIPLYGERLTFAFICLYLEIGSMTVCNCTIATSPPMNTPNCTEMRYEGCNTLLRQAPSIAEEAILR